jgi:hypothetical protein
MGVGQLLGGRGDDPKFQGAPGGLAKIVDTVFYAQFFPKINKLLLLLLLKNLVVLGRIFLHQLSSHLESHLNCYFF